MRFHSQGHLTVKNQLVNITLKKKKAFHSHMNKETLIKEYLCCYCFFLAYSNLIEMTWNWKWRREIRINPVLGTGIILLIPDPETFIIVF